MTPAQAIAPVHPAQGWAPEASRAQGRWRGT
jgi:hypothetical protein